jgi:hypothetical protein
VRQVQGASARRKRGGGRTTSALQRRQGRRQQAQFAHAGMRQQQLGEHARRPAAAGELGVEVGMPAGQHGLGRARHLVGAPQRRMEIFKGLQDGHDSPRTGASGR